MSYGVFNVEKKIENGISVMINIVCAQSEAGGNQFSPVSFCFCAARSWKIRFWGGKFCALMVPFHPRANYEECSHVQKKPVKEEPDEPLFVRKTCIF